MNDGWKIFVLICLFAVAVFVVRLRLDYHYSGKTQECVLTQPREAASGSISSSGFVFKLSYSGTTKRTGEPCSIEKAVTVFEYDRMMYGSGK